MTKDEFVGALLLLGFRKNTPTTNNNMYSKTYYSKKGVPTYVNARISKKAATVQISYRKPNRMWQSSPASTPKAAIQFIQRRFL